MEEAKNDYDRADRDENMTKNQVYKARSLIVFLG
jgi:hypothetical protein